MNWTKFQTYGMASDKAFETLCNQLFTNWVKDEYGSEVISVKVVNGAGGDGGVESYATLKNGAVILLNTVQTPVISFALMILPVTLLTTATFL